MVREGSIGPCSPFFSVMGRRDRPLTPPPANKFCEMKANRAGPSDFNFESSMAKSSSKAKRSPASSPAMGIGKGKVTPIQIAFIVERFLADNNYENTLAAFRSEASDLFSKAKGKEVPKGLLGLGDILDEYISLKEQRIMVDQEKRKVEIAFQGLQDVMRAYNSPQWLSPVLSAPNGAFCHGSNPSNASPPQGHVINGSFVNISQPAMLLPHVEETTKISTPMPTGSMGGKRKVSGSTPKLSAPPKKCCSGLTKISHNMDDTTSSGKAPSASNTRVNKGSISSAMSMATSLIVPSSLPHSSIEKSLFKNPREIPSNSSSPKTPPQALQCQYGESVSPTENSSLNANDASSSQRPVPSRCAIISSDRIIISPLKNKGYYAVERSYHVSASPLKSRPDMMNTREHIKGRLDFGESSAHQSSQEPVATESSPSMTGGEAAGSFDFDLPVFDFFDGDFSKLLHDIDLDCEQAHSYQQSSAPSGFLPCLEQNVDDGCLEINQALPNPHLSTVTEIISQKGTNIQGPDTMTTMRSITKRIMISSPSKSSSNC